MFKRWRLSTTNHLVNASPALALLFLASACGNAGDTANDAPAIAETQAIETPQETGAEDMMTMPAIWSSRDLGGEISSIALAGGLGSRVAVTFADGSLQLLDFDGDRITEKAPLDVAQVTDGRYLLLSGTPVTMFPGINNDGDLTVYIHGGELAAPLAYPLDSGEETALGGLCSGQPTGEVDGVLRLAFWTQSNDTVLNSGRVVEVNNELVFLPDEPVRADRPITACILGADGASVFAAPTIAADTITRAGATTTFVLDSSGGLSFANDRLGAAPFTVSDGITVRVPKVPADMAAVTDTRSGGYSSGVLTLAGQNNAGDDIVIFIDPSNLTRSVLEPKLD